MKNILAFNYIEHEYQEFDTIEEARNFLEECFLEKTEGYHPDNGSL